MEFETVYITKEYPHWTDEDAIANEVLKARGIEEKPTIRVIQTQRELEKLPEQQRKEQEEKLLQYTEVCKQVYFQRRSYYIIRPSSFGESKDCTRSFAEGPFSTKPAEISQELYKCQALETFIPAPQFPAHFERVELVKYGICDAVATHSKIHIPSACINLLEKQTEKALFLFKETYKTEHYFCLSYERSYRQAITPNYIIRLFISDWKGHKTYSPKERRQEHLPQYPTILLSTFGKPGSFDQVCSELQLHSLEDIFENKHDKNLRTWHERKYGLAHNLSLSEYGHNFGKHFSSGKVIL